MTAPTTSRRRLPLLQGIVPLDRARIPAEMLAGVTLAALAIPEVMGYSSIAGMPVITGMYTLLLPMLAFALLGSSRHLVVGADSATAAVMASGLAALAVAGSKEYVALAGALALVTAVLLIVARLVKLGFIADFLSRTVLVGFLTGVGIQVACGQVAGMLGLPSGSGVTIGGHTFGGTLGKLGSTLRDVDDSSLSTVAVSVTVLLTIIGMKALIPKVPGALVAVVGAIAVSWNWDLASHGVATLGALPSGLPALGLPDVSLSQIPALIGTAGSIFVLVLAQSAATSRAYAAKYDEDFDENVDLVGLTAASAAAGVSGTFVVNGSPTKTQMVDDAGGRSQVAQLTTAALVVVVLLFLTEPISYMPEAVLAAIVFLIGIELVDVAGMRKVLRLRPDEFVVAALVAVTVVAVGVQQAIVLAIVASVIDHLRRSYRPATGVLHPGPDSTWLIAPPEPTARTLPGLAVYQFAGSLYYANAGLFLEQTAGIAESTEPLRWLGIDAVAIPDVDYSAGETLRQLHGQLRERGVDLVVIRPNEVVRRELTTYGLAELIGDAFIFPTLHEAVAAYRALPPTSTETA